jgi:hypothetical protein
LATNFILFADLCEEKEKEEKEEAASLDHRHHQAGLLQTQTGQQKNPSR